MKRLSLLALAVTVILIPKPVQALNEMFDYTVIGVDKQMPSPARTIFAEENGYLWAGTSDGVVRFDGESHNLYSARPGNANTIPDNVVNCIVSDQNGQVWVATDKGLARYRKQTDDFELIGKMVVKSAFPAADCCYFGGVDSLFRYDYGDRQMHLVKEFPTETPFVVEGIFPWTEGRLVLSCGARGIVIFDPRVSTIHEPAADFSGSRRIWVDSKYRIWRSIRGAGVECYSSDFSLISSYSVADGNLGSDNAISFCEVEDNIWIGTESGGVTIISPDRGTATFLKYDSRDRRSIPATSVQYLFCNDRQTVYAARSNGGLIVIRKVRISEDLISASGPTFLCPEGIASSYQGKDDKDVWLGTDGSGIISLDTATGEYHTYPSGTDCNFRIVSMVDYSRGKLLLYAANTGFFLFDKNSGAMQRHSFNSEDLSGFNGGAFEIVELCESPDGNVLICNDEAMFSVNPANGAVSSCSLVTTAKRNGTIQKVSGSTPGKYFFNNRRIFEYNPSSVSLKEIYDLGEGAGITSAAVDNSDRIWITSNDSLSCYSVWSGSLENIPFDVPMRLSSVLCDNMDRVWAAGRDGICIYSLASKSFFALDNADGVTTGNFLPRPSILASDGTLCFAGLSSVVQIDNSFSIRSFDNPVIELQDFRTFGQRWSDADDVSLPNNCSYVRFRVFARESGLFRKKLYRFKAVNGDDETVLISSNPDITIHGVKAGSYTVYASCSTKSAKWTDWVQIASFRISQSWYTKWWFILAALMLLVGLLSYIILNAGRNRDNQVKIERIKQKYQSDEERLTFLVNVSHELRTPLTLILGPIERILAGTQKDNPNYNQLKGVQRQARKMKTLLNTVLTAHKIQDGPTHSLEAQQFNGWTKGVAQDFSEEAESRKVDINLDLDPSLGIVSFDSEKCEIVLSNIIMNALTHSPDNSEITIKTAFRPERDVVRVSVADKGPGIDEDTVEKLFQRFYQETENRASGYGIGLSYSKTIIDQMHGRISAFNNESGGATFFFEIPANAAKPVLGTIIDNDTPATGEPAVDFNETATIAGNSTPEKPAGETAAPKAPAPIAKHAGEPLSDFVDDSASPITNLNQATLLVVEDDFELRQYLQEELTGPINRVLLAENGAEAVKVLGKEHVDVIVSDVMMPEMDGFALCRYVKTTVAVSHIPVILLTARSDENSRMLGYKNGADDYITKPFDLNVLQDSINNLFRNREAMRQRYASEGPMPSSKETTFSSADEKFMKKFDELVAENISDPDLDTKLLVNGMGMSRTVLFNKVKQLTGLNIQSYVNKVRMEYVIKLMKETDLPLAEIAEKAGFSSPRYFSTSFKNYTGTTPSQYKKDLS